MRAVLLLPVLVVVLTAALISEAMWDSAVGAWVAVGAVFAILAVRMLAWLSGMPDWWPFGGDGDA